MKYLSVDGVRLYFSAEERAAAELITGAVERSLGLLAAGWGLAPPRDCRIYIMTSWQRFLIQALPWPQKALLPLYFPLGYRAYSRLWRVAGGWTLQYSRRPAIGIKPPRLIEAADRRIGEQIFVREEDASVKVQDIACHELTHACTAHLKLPVWLNEGLAMLAVDRLDGRETVRRQTLARLNAAAPHRKRDSYRSLQRRDPEAAVMHYIRGYWLTRYLEETQPGLLRRLLSQQPSAAGLEGQIAARLGLDRARFWPEMDARLVGHFAA